MSINLVSLVGNVGRTPELQYLQSGHCTLTFSMALNRPARDGQPQPPTWVDCKVWNKTAQFCADHLTKGSKVAVVGRLEVEEWTDKNTQEKRRRTVVVGERVELCDRKPREDAPAGSTEDVPF